MGLNRKGDLLEQHRAHEGDPTGQQQAHGPVEVGADPGLQLDAGAVDLGVQPVVGTVDLGVEFGVQPLVIVVHLDVQGAQILLDEGEPAVHLVEDVAGGQFGGLGHGAKDMQFPGQSEAL